MATIIDEVVNITITRDSVGVTRADFGTILIFGDSEPDFYPEVRTYSNLTEVLDDFATTTPEYKMAAGIFAQPIKTDKILIAQINDSPAESYAEAYARVSAEYGDRFYAVAITAQAEQDVLDIAALVEADSKMFAVVTDDVDVKTDGDSVLKSLAALGYNRTFCIYTDTIENYANTAWLGAMLPLQPGSAKWAYRNLVGVSDISDLTATGRANVKLRKGNYYMPLAGTNVTFLGTMVSGEYIDVIHGLDWLESYIQENIAQLLIAAPKIPYNNNGIGLIENSLRASLQEAVNRGIINDGFTITTPDILTISSVDKAARLLKDVSFSAVLTGAIQNITINGTVTV